MAYAPTSTRTLVDQKTAAIATTTHAKIGSQGNERRWRLRQILASYGTATQTGTVTVTGLDGGSATPVTLTFNFTGSTVLEFGENGIRCLGWTDLVVTLSAGAAAVVGNLTTIAFPE